MKRAASKAESDNANATLGILAGGGRLPLQLVESCLASGRKFFVVAFEESADIEAISHVPHAVVRLGAVGETLDHLRKHKVEDVVMAGKVKRPSFGSLRPDMMGTKLMARMGAAIFGGDDALLKAIVGFLEDEGFNVVGSDDIIGGLAAPLGVMGKIKPSRDAEKDIAKGVKAAKMLGELDIGQAAIVENGYVLGVEGAEGTDELIHRCGKLRREKKSGVLVKMRKPGQEERVDLPAVGVQTVERVHEAGFAGIAVEAEGCLMLDKDKVIDKADKLGLFIVGVKNE